MFPVNTPWRLYIFWKFLGILNGNTASIVNKTQSFEALTAKKILVRSLFFKIKHLHGHSGNAPD